MKKIANLCLLPFVLLANGDDIDKILKELDTHTDIANNTKHNIDYKPYIISVWNKDELERIGVQTLKDAVLLVPGVDIYSDNLDYKTAIFRSSNPLAYGQSRLFIDGIDVNDRTFNGYSIFFDMPIENIERIEVVRGPGDGSYAGSINVITDRTKNYLFGAIGSYNTKKGGFSQNITNGDFKLHTSFNFLKDDKFIPTEGYDALWFNPLNKNLSQNQEASLYTKQYNLHINGEYKKLSLNAIILNYEKGSGFGNLYVLPNRDAHINMPFRSFEMNYDNFKIGSVEDTWRSEAKSYPIGFQYKLPNGNIVTFKDGYDASLAIKQLKLYNSYSKTFDISNHKINTGYYISKEKNIEQQTITTNKLTGIGLVDYSSNIYFFDGKNAKRDSAKLYFDDEWFLNDYISIMYGGAIEWYSDTGFQNTYRLATVYQPTTKDIFKFMISSSFRNPSWQEMYGANNSARVGNRDLSPEKVFGLESQYIKKFSTRNSMAINLFYLSNKEQISKTNTLNQYRNTADAKIYGFETELKTALSSNSNLYLTYSFSNGKCYSDIKSCILPNTSKHLIKGYFTYDILDSLQSSTIAHYQSSKNRLYNDSREDISSSGTIDQIFTYKTNLFKLQLAIKNIFDKKILYPSEPFTYQNDYPAGGREYTFKISKEF
jgi:iron complex outermembrane receptor protein